MKKQPLSKSVNVKNLESLLNDENSCISLIRMQEHMALQPYHLNDFNNSIKEILNTKIGKFSRKLDGILCGYKNLTLLSKTGKVCQDSFFIHVDVEADFFIFKPTTTSQKLLKGVVNKKSKDHIGCLVHGIFNVSLPKPKHAEDWIGHVLEVQSDVMVRITYTNFDGKLPYLRGEIAIDEDEHILEEKVDEIDEDNVGKKRKKRKKENETGEYETPVKKKKTKDRSQRKKGIDTSVASLEIEN